MKTSEEWIKDIESKIETLRTKGIKSLFYPSSKMTSSTAASVEIHFKELGYDTEFKKCFRCNNKWDIIIQWSL